MSTPGVKHLPPYARFISPTAGAWLRACLNPLLRVFVKWRTGLTIDIERLRTRQARIDRRLGRHVAGVERTRVVCGNVAAEWLAPAQSGTQRVLLYLHGGAFVARSPNAHAAMVAPWCGRLGARALMVDYRLAPEHPHPAAIEDCHAAWCWLLARGYDARQIVIGGDSAGGTLALALLQRIRGDGGPMPACAVLLSPFVDLTLSSPSMVANARRDPIFTPAFALAIRAHYAPPQRWLDAGVSPLYGAFDGLPPLLLQVGSTEMLLDDAIRTAQRAHAAGVPVALEVWDRLPHVFQALPWLPQAGQAAAHIVDFIAAHTGWNGAASPVAEQAATFGSP